MKRFLALVLAALASLSVSGQNSGKFAFFADTHIAEGAKSIEELEACIEDVNRNPEIEFSILAGDITEFGSDREIRLAKSIIDKLEKPYYVVAGNHDAKWSESGCNTFEKVFGYGHFEFEAFGLKFVGTNSGPNMRMAPALVPRESIVLLDSLVKATPSDKPLIFVNHFPQDTSVLNYFQVLDILKESNIQLVMGGHWHNNVVLDYEGIPGILLRSSQARGRKGPGYSIVTVDNGKISVSEKVVGMEPFEPWYELQMTESLPFNRRHQIYGQRPDYSSNDKYPNVKEVWTLQESGDIGAGAVCSEDNVVYTTTQGYVKCVSLISGEEKWSVKLNGKVYSTPAVYKKYVVVGCADNIIYCLDIKSGRELWRHHCDKSVLASPNIYDGVVYIGASDGRFRALNLKTGHLVWSFSDVKGFVESKAYVDEAQVVFGDWANTLYSLDRASGKLMWTWRVKGSRMYSPAAVWPVKSGNRLFIVTPERKTYSIEASSGSTMWEHRGGRESVGISALGDRVFVKTMKDTVFCFSTAPAMKAQVLWATDTKIGYDIAPTPTAYYEGIAFVPTDKGTIVALNAETGEMLWKYKLSFALVNSIVPVADAKERKILVTTMDGKVSLLSY